MRRIATVLCLALSSACCSTAPGEHVVNARAKEVLPLVAQRLGVPERTIAVRLTDGIDARHFGAVLDGEIVMDSAFVQDPMLRWMLAHEGVHALIPDDLKMLPAAVQEGLADYVASQIDPTVGAMRVGQLQRTLDSGIRNRWGLAPTDAFALSMDAIFEMHDPFRAQFVYALGYAVVERLGLERLRALCQEARAQGRDSVLVPLLCAHAGLNDQTPVGWTVAAAR